jgi:hypothetical protein
MAVEVPLWARSEAYRVTCYIDVKIPKNMAPPCTLRHRRRLGCKQHLPALLLLEGCEVTQAEYRPHVLECLQTVI